MNHIIPVLYILIYFVYLLCLWLSWVCENLVIIKILVFPSTSNSFFSDDLMFTQYLEFHKNDFKNMLTDYSTIGNHTVMTAFAPIRCVRGTLLLQIIFLKMLYETHLLPEVFSLNFPLSDINTANIVLSLPVSACIFMSISF